MFNNLCAVILAAVTLGIMSGARADISLLQPPRLVDGNQPLTLTLLVTADEQVEQTYSLPATLELTASAEMTAPVRLQLQRDVRSPAEVTLHPGEFRKISYRGALPTYLRGTLRIEAHGMDTSPMLVAVIRSTDAHATVTAGPRTDATVSMSTAAVRRDNPTGIDPAAALYDTPRLSFHEPVYFAAGDSGGNRDARFQLSFKFRLLQPDDMRSRSLIDNLYFGYTQYSLWDLQSPSAPFRDTNYRPSLFYYLPDLGLHNNWLDRMAIAAGLEHESNGRAGPDSRSLNTLFVEPTFVFGKREGMQLRVAPKMYTYLGSMSDNPDLGQYRGHADIKLAVGRQDGIELSTTLRKGTRSGAGSADSTLSYPLAKLIPGMAGYLMTSYFYGYGESLLTYDQKQTPQLRFGYSLRR